MSLNITKSDEVIEVQNICLTIYSQPGLGKTSLAFTASNPLLLDFDRGAHRAVDRKDVVQVSDWRDVAGITAADVAPYDTIIIDTVGKALEALTSDILRNNSKLGYGGALNQQGWGQLSTRFGAYLKMLRGFGKDVVLISHMEEKHDGDSMKERLEIPGGTKKTVHSDSDVIARISIFERERNIVFTPTETTFGKDPAGIGSMPLPDASSDDFPTCLADIIKTIKGKLNELSEAQMEHAAEVEWFRENLPGMENSEQINAVLDRASKAGVGVKKMVAERAKVLGLPFDMQARAYKDRKDAA